MRPGSPAGEGRTARAPEKLEAQRTGGVLVDFYKIREIWGKNWAVFVGSLVWELRGAVLPRDGIAAWHGCEIRESAVNCAVELQDILRG